MIAFPDKLHKKILERAQENALRVLDEPSNLVDFSSNDYLGLSRAEPIREALARELALYPGLLSGSTGSRLLSGNHHCHIALEDYLSDFHKAEAALLFNSGYDANLGFFSSVPQRGDVVLYDQYAHASIRDGLQMSHAHRYKFKHNDLKDLKLLLEKHKKNASQLYVVTESVFSMDGDHPDLEAMLELTESCGAYLVVDEAHAVGVVGYKGEGSVQSLNLERRVFARIITFGKAIGGHGAAVLGSNPLKVFLYNFARSFIYTTAISPHAVMVIQTTYRAMSAQDEDSYFHKQRKMLLNNIEFFKSELRKLPLKNMRYIESDSAIQCVLVPGNDRVKNLANRLIANGFDVKPILSPTVPKGEERIRCCVHSFNTFDEISGVLKQLLN